MCARLSTSTAACALTLAALGAGCSRTPARTTSGLWDAVIVANNAEVPFRFEIAQNEHHVEGFFFEGDRKVGSTSGSFENGTLRLDYDFLNTTLEATLEGDELRGTYRNKRAERASAGISGATVCARAGDGGRGPSGRGQLGHVSNRRRQVEA